MIFFFVFELCISIFNFNWKATFSLNSPWPKLRVCLIHILAVLTFIVLPCMWCVLCISRNNFILYFTTYKGKYFYYMFLFSINRDISTFFQVKRYIRKISCTTIKNHVHTSILIYLILFFWLCSMYFCRRNRSY